MSAASADSEPGPKGLEPPALYLRAWRRLRGMTQQDLAEALTEAGLGSWYKGDISNFEGGGRRWNADHLAAFAHVLHCEPADLLRDPQSGALLDIARDVPPSRQADAARILRALSEPETPPFAHDPGPPQRRKRR